MAEVGLSFTAIVFGFAVFALIVAVGWRSVQNRRILRLQGANGQETIVIARQDNDISSIVATTSTTETTQTAPNPTPAPAQSAVFERDRLNRVVSSAKK